MGEKNLFIPASGARTVATTIAGTELMLILQGAEIKTVTPDVLKEFAGFDKGYLEFGARLAQASTSAPSKQTTFVDEITNDGVDPTDPLYRSLSFIRNSTGDFSFIITSNEANPINPSDVDLSFSDGKCRAIGTSNSTSSPFQYAVFTFRSYQPDGTLADGVISFTNIHAKLYP